MRRALRAGSASEVAVAALTSAGVVALVTASIAVVRPYVPVLSGNGRLADAALFRPLCGRGREAAE